MTLLVEKGTFTKTTSTSTPVSQQVNLANGSLTPKLLILWTGGQTTSDGTYRDDNRWSYGFSDGTNDACQALRLDESAEVESYSFHDNAVCVIINLTTNAIVSQADVSAFAAGSFTLNWSVQSNTEALHIHYLVAGGTDITNVSVVNTTVGSTTTGNKSYNGSGTTFTPDFALTMTGADSYATANTLVNSTDVGLLCVGAARSTSKEWVMFGREETVATSDCDMYLDPDACVAACSITDGSITFLGNFISFDSAAGGGITINVSNAAEASTKKLAFLLVKGAQWDCGAFQQRNGTGTQDVTLPTDFDPQLVFLGGINSASSATVVANDYLCLGASDGTNEGAVYGGNTNALGTYAAVNSNIHTKVYRMSTPNATATSSTTNAEADMNDMATLGKFQLNWTTADSTLRRMVYWTLGPSLERISKQLTVKWNNESRISKQLTLKWNNIQRLSKQLTLKWNNLQRVSKQLTVKWDIEQALERISKSLTLKWNNESRISKQLTLKWNNIQRISKQLTLKWNNLLRVSKQLTLKWDNLQRISKQLSLKWDNLQRISKQLTLKWNNESRISKALTLKWNNIQRISKSLTLKWNDIQRISKQLTLKWDVVAGGLERISKSLTLKWNNEARVSKQLTLKWDNLQRISKQLTLKWHNLQRISKQLTLKWNNIQRISKQLTLKWDNLIRVSKQLTLRWDNLVRVSKQLTLRWDTIARISKQLRIKWRIESTVLPKKIFKVIASKFGVGSRGRGKIPSGGFQREKYNRNWDGVEP